MIHDTRFPGESDEYREARNKLLNAEIELREQIEGIASLRRELPLGGRVKEDYEFEELETIPGNGEVKGEEQRSDGKQRDLQPLGKIRPSPRRRGDKFRRESPRLFIETGVDDRAVRFTRARADVVPLVEHQHRHVRAGECICQGAADDTRAHNDDIVGLGWRLVGALEAN